MLWVSAYDSKYTIFKGKGAEIQQFDPKVEQKRNIKGSTLYLEIRVVIAVIQDRAIANNEDTKIMYLISVTLGAISPY